jgi:4'-phosphopantetheinyl transferase EntD
MFRIVSFQSHMSCQPAGGVDAIRSLFPPSVVVVERRRPGNPADLLPAEAVYVAKAVAKRVNEFAAGRACAREALGAFGVTGFALLAAPDRQPLWPTSYVGSITHTAGFCAAAVVLRSKFMSLGLDSERSGAPSVDVWPTLCRTEELAWVDSLAPSERPAAVTLIFSAKEAVYKCQYPITGEWLDFHDLKVEVPEWGNPRGSFTVSATRDIKIAQLAKLPQGRFSFHEEFVSTALCIPA